MNKPKNTMKVSFPSRGANEGLARMLVAAFITEADPTVEELCDIKTAVSEAVTNCIVHAYPDRIGEIYIAASLSESNLVTIKVRTTGAASPMCKRRWSRCLPPAAANGPGWALR